MAKAKNLVTSLGIVTVGEEIDIFVPKVEREIPRSVSGMATSASASVYLYT